MLRRNPCRVKRIGIYGGTFDPIHVGHMAFAEYALTQGIDMVYFLPEPRPRRKQGVRALEHRIAMIQVAIQDNPKLGVIQLEHARFTPHETLPILTRRFPGTQLVLLFGDDVMSHIASWPHIDELVGGVELLVALRDDTSEAGIHQRFRTLAEVSGLNFSYKISQVAHTTVSSSDVRLRLRNGEQPTDVVPAAVMAYIRKTRLYRPHPKPRA